MAEMLWFDVAKLLREHLTLHRWALACGMGTLQQPARSKEILCASSILKLLKVTQEVTQDGLLPDVHQRKPVRPSLSRHVGNFPSPVDNWAPAHYVACHAVLFALFGDAMLKASSACCEVAKIQGERASSVDSIKTEYGHFRVPVSTAHDVCNDICIVSGQNRCSAENRFEIIAAAKLVSPNHSAKLSAESVAT